MAKVRSPNYPNLDLGAALEAVRPALKAENRNKMARSVLARHMGYNSLNGRALTKLGAVRAFGLIDGAGDDLKISDDAVTALVSPDKAGFVYRDALERLALKPQLFVDIKKQFPATLPSEQNLAFWLVQQGYTQDAAGKAAKNYLATMRLVYDESGSYNPPENAEDEAMIEQQSQVKPQRKSLLDLPASSIKQPGVLHAGMLQEVFNLEEGPVTLMFPGNLSEDSYQDLEDRLKIVLRGLKRRSTVRQMMIEDSGKGLDPDE